MNILLHTLMSWAGVEGMDKLNVICVRVIGEIRSTAVTIIEWAVCANSPKTNYDISAERSQNQQYNPTVSVFFSRLRQLYNTQTEVDNSFVDGEQIWKL